MRKWFSLRRSVVGLTVAVALGAIFVAAAGAFNSGDNPGTTGPNTITWTGQGASNGVLNTTYCDAANDPNGAGAPYLLWILTVDGGSITNDSTTPVLHLGGSGSGDYTTSNPSDNSAAHFVTPYFTPDSSLTASADINVLTTGNGAWNLVISHGCPGGSTPPASDLIASKTATPALSRTFSWAVSKKVDKTSVTQTNGSPTATFNYTVTATPSYSAANDVYTVAGAITVDNPNISSTSTPDDVTGVLVTDAIDNEPNATCTVTDGSASGNAPFTVDHTNATIPDGSSIIFPYSCTYTQAPASTSQTNIATVSYITQTLGDGSILAGNSVNSQPVSIDWTSVTPSLVHNCTNITDTYAPSGMTGTPVGLAGNVCTDANGNLPSTDGALVTGATYATSPAVTGVLNPVTTCPTTCGPYTSLDLKYSRTVTPPTLGTCVKYDNTATYTATDDSTDTGNSSQVEVTVCNFNAPLTIGYWGNHLNKTGGTGCTGLPNGTGCNSNGPFTLTYLPQCVGSLSAFSLTTYNATPCTPGYLVDTILKAAKVFAANNCSNASTSPSNATACLAAQLLGAELNVANKANYCIATVKDGINDANNFLAGGTVDGVTGVVYPGPGVSISFGSSANQTKVRNEALVLKNELVNYNQGGGC